MICGLKVYIYIKYIWINTDCCLDAVQIVFLDLINQQFQWCAVAPQVWGDPFHNALHPRFLQRWHMVQVYTILNVVVISLTGQKKSQKIVDKIIHLYPVNHSAPICNSKIWFNMWISHFYCARTNFPCACFLNDLQYILSILLVFIYLRCTTMEVQINVFLLLAFTILPNQNACLSKGNHSQ